MKSRRLDVAQGEERYELLLEVGEIFATQLQDRTRAAKTYIVALEDRPDDRNLLTKLMQLYSEEKDWGKLVEVVLKLSDFVDDKKQKAKYLHTAAMVSARQLGEIDDALDYYERALELDPTQGRALEEAIELRTQKGDYRGVETLLKIKLDHANDANDQAKMLETFEELADLYHKNLGWISAAIDAYEAAQTLDPENKQRTEMLAELYAVRSGAVPRQGGQRASRHPAPQSRSRRIVQAAPASLHRDEARRRGVVHVPGALLLNLAEPDEERFFRRMRADSPAAAQAQVTFDDFQSLLVHEDADPMLSAIFALIEPAIIAARTQPLEPLGYDPRYAIDLAASAHPISQTLYWAASVLGMPRPPPSRTPTILAGSRSCTRRSRRSSSDARRSKRDRAAGGGVHRVAPPHLLPPRLLRAAPRADGHRPQGVALRGDQNDLAAVPGPGRPREAMHESMAALDRAFVGPTREHLASVVSKLLPAGGALDLKKWVGAVDLTADRAGFLLAHDLQVAGELIKASGEDASAVPVKERLRELILFATSEQYFTLRANWA